MLKINEIYNIDCKELFENIPKKSIDMIFTDPPYELENHGGGKNPDFGTRKLSNKHINFISNGFDLSIFNEFERVCKVVNIVVFCSNKQISKIMSWWENKGYSTTLLIWKKKNPIPLANGKFVSDTEYMIYVRGKKAIFNNLKANEMSKVFEYSSPTDRIHPTEKPIDLLRKILNILTNKNQLVLDCYSGSGSLARACYIEERNFICSENNNYFYTESIKKLNQLTNQFTLSFS